MFSFRYFLFLYVIVGAIAIAVAVRKTEPGPKRVFVFATVFSLFFSLGLAVGHGIMPYPGLLLAGICVFQDCGKMYGSPSAALLLVGLPMIVQWLIVLAISFGIYRLAMKRQHREIQRGGAQVDRSVHKPVIGSLWLLVGIVVLLVSSYFVWFLLTQEEVRNSIRFQIGAFFLLGALQLLSGLALLLDVPWSRWLCIPMSVLALPVFPLGTALGAYYLWYFATIERKHDQTSWQF